MGRSAMVYQADSKRFFYFFTLIAAFALSLLVATPSHGQVSGATVTGTVTDPSGAVIPNAQVAITDVATGVTRNVTTGGAGF